MEYKLKCVECGEFLPADSYYNRKYCSGKCKARYRKKNPVGSLSQGHICRVCGKLIELQPGQGNKWLCSAECRRASVAKSVRTFYKRQPAMEAIYRARTKAKRLPNDNLTRFRRTNPDAPMACESCGETRVLDVAHKSEHRRNGEWRSSKNCSWPEKVWVLCPTCHALLDRMHYSPEELGLA